MDSGCDMLLLPFGLENFWIAKPFSLDAVLEVYIPLDSRPGHLMHNHISFASAQTLFGPSSGSSQSTMPPVDGLDAVITKPLELHLLLALRLQGSDLLGQFWRRFETSHLDSGSSSQDLRRAQEVSTLDAGNEVEHITTNTTAEAVVLLLRGMHGERRSFFRMERTQAEEVLAAFSQFDIFTSERH